MKRTHKPTGHGPGRGKVNLSCTIPVEIDRQLRQLAEESGLTRAGYAKKAVIRAVQRREKVTEQVVSEAIYPLEHPANPTARAADDAAL